jgi:hypothetical protein
VTEDYFQHRDISNLYLNPIEWYTSQDHFAFHVGEQVVSIDAAAKTVHTSKGNTWHSWMQSHTFLTSGKNSSSVVTTPVTSKPWVSI